MNLEQLLKEQFNKWSNCKSWELSKDKFFVDATPEEIMDWHKKSMKAMFEKLADDVYNLPQGEGVTGASDFIREQIEKL